MFKDLIVNINMNSLIKQPVSVKNVMSVHVTKVKMIWLLKVKFFGFIQNKVVYKQSYTRTHALCLLFLYTLPRALFFP